MTDDFNRYFLAALAFAFVVTWATLGAVVALVAAAVCAGTVFGLPARRRRRPVRRPTVAHELVPDDPSLILSVSRSG